MPEPLVVRLSDRPGDTYVLPCTCTHRYDEHRAGGLACRAPDSYGCPCECPSYEPDPNDFYAEEMRRDIRCTTREYTTRQQQNQPITTGQNMTAPRRWSTKDEVAEHLKVSTKTVDRLVDAGTITAYPIGPRLVRFDLEEIDASMANVAAAEVSP